MRAKTRSRLARFLGGLVIIFGILILVALGGLILLQRRLTEGPIDVSWAAPKVLELLNERIQDGYVFDAKGAEVALSRNQIVLSLNDIGLSNALGKKILKVPKANLNFQPMDLAVGRIDPKRIEFDRVELNLSIFPDGKFAIASGDGLQGDIPIVEAFQSQGNENSTTASPVPEALAAPEGLIVRQVLDRLSGPQSPLRAINYISLTNSRIQIVDKAKNRAIHFEHVDIQLARDKDSIAITLGADGPNGRWTIIALTDLDVSDERKLSLEVKELSFDEIALAIGWSQPGFVLDSPISLKGDISLDRSGLVTEARGKILFGSGLFELDNRDFEPVIFDDFAIGMHFEAKDKKFAIDEFVYNADDTHISGTGSIDFVSPSEFAQENAQENAQSRLWHFGIIVNSGSQFGTERPKEKPILFTSAELRGSVDYFNQRIEIERFAMAGDDLDFEAGGTIELKPAHVTMAFTAKDCNLTYVPRLLPSMVAAPVRSWMVDRINAGHLVRMSGAIDFDAETLAQVLVDGPLDDEAQRIEGSVDNVTLSVKPGLPIVAGLSAEGSVSGRTVHITTSKGIVEDGEGHHLSLLDGRYDMNDIALRPPPASMVGHLTGTLEATTHLLMMDALRPYVNFPLDPQTIRGQVDGKLLIDLLLVPEDDPNSVKARVVGTLNNFSADHVVGKEKLEGATLSLTGDKSGMHAVGSGRVLGAPASVELNKIGTEPAQVMLALNLDEAARSKLGLSSPGISGQIGTKISGELGQNGSFKGQMDLDLGKTILDNPLPGVVKAAGKPGKASLKVVVDPQATVLEDIVVEAGSVLVHANADMGTDGQLQSARISQLRLSAGDDMKGEVSRVGDSLKILLHGTEFDGRPAISQFMNPPATGTKDADLDLSLKAGRILGNNKQVLTDGDLHILRRSGLLQQFKLTGAIDNSMISGTSNEPGTIEVRTNNAGGFLSFIDLYKHMQSGILQMTIQMDSGQSQGKLEIDNFALRDEPAIAQLVAKAEPQHPGDPRYQPSKFNASDVAFDKLSLNFKRSEGGRLDFYDGAMYGPQIGATVEGMLDFSHNRVDVNGTFVPAYGLNNFFARIPILGLILGGDSQEGLFAITFRLSGPTTGPTLALNPLSAIAPGFLRKIFGATELPSGFKNPGRDTGRDNGPN